MAGLINFKRVAIPGLNPDADHVFVGIDVVDNKLYVKNTAGTVFKYQTASESQAQVDAHANRTDNPHATTKAQVGLGNVDNTSDVNKPVSTAQALADAAVQAFSIQRANHTGTQTASTISDFNAAVLAYINTLGLVTQPATTAVSATGVTTTTSTTDVLLTGMTITPPAGTYQVTGATTVAHNTSSANIFLSVYAGGTQVAASQLQAIPTFPSGAGIGAGTSNIVIPMTAIAEVTVDGTQAIQLRWRTSAGTASAGNRMMNITRVR